MSEAKPKKNSDLPVRVASAIVMVAIAGTALWLGGWLWISFVALLAVGVFYEWSKLASALAKSASGRLIWLLAGVIYIGIAAYTLGAIRFRQAMYYGSPDDGYGPTSAAMLVLVVIAVDVGAYFVGRAIGGPKIAPSISPSKTWAGYAGGAFGAFLVILGYRTLNLYRIDADYGFPDFAHLVPLVAAGLIVGAIAQAGDFFESWMKRKANVKDSSNLIPGHGGLFDRVDGLLALAFVVGVLSHLIGLWLV